MLSQLNYPGYVELKRTMYSSGILEQVCSDIIKQSYSL